MKVALSNVTNGTNVSAINDNFAQIQDALNLGTLWRDNPVGEPNQMINLLDMNGNRLINLPAPISNTDAARLQDVQDAIAGAKTATLTQFNPYKTITGTNVQSAIQQVKDEHDLSALLENIKQFNATGNGITDDTTAIVAAATSGRTIFLPSGTYLMSNSIFTSDISFVGEDMFKTVIKWASGSIESSLFGFNGAQVNVSFKNLTIDSNSQNQTDSTGYYGAIGGSVAAGSHLSFENVQFKNGRISDIYLSGPTDVNQYAYISIRKCIFQDGILATNTRAAQAVGLSEGFVVDFSNNSMIMTIPPASFGRGGLVVQRPANDTATSEASVSVKDNFFLNFGISGSNVLGCVYIYSGAEQIIISGNEAKNSYGTAFCAKADSGNIVIANNSVVNHNDPNVAAITFFNQAVPYTNTIGLNLIITGNVIKNPQLTSIFVDGARISGANFANIVVTDNVCYGGQRGIHYRNVAGIRLSGNIINNTSSTAIFSEGQVGSSSIVDNTLASGAIAIDMNGVTDAVRVEVCRNLITSMSSIALRLRTNVESFDISNNTIVGCTSAIVTSGSTQMSTIRNNVIRGETSAWDKSGSYAALQYEGNITSTTLSFNTRSIAISANAITPFASWHYVDTDSGASASDLITINGGYEGKELTLFCASTSRVVTLRDNTGNLRLNGDFSLTSSNWVIRLICRSNTWYELSRSQN